MVGVVRMSSACRPRGVIEGVNGIARDAGSLVGLLVGRERFPTVAGLTPVGWNEGRGVKAGLGVLCHVSPYFEWRL